MRFDGVKWVWFDLDDTLMDFHANSRLANRLLFREARLDRYCPSPEEWIAAYEAHNKTLWDRYSRAEITQDFLRVDRFAPPLRETVMIDGAVSLLSHLRAHYYNIGVLSNGFRDVQYRKLRNSGLDRMVDLTVLSDDIGVNKPDPRLFAYAMGRAGCTVPEANLMVGDNLGADIGGALGAAWGAVHFDRSAPALMSGGKYLTTPDLGLLRGLL